MESTSQIIHPLNCRINIWSDVYNVSAYIWELENDKCIIKHVQLENDQLDFVNKTRLSWITDNVPTK